MTDINDHTITGDDDSETHKQMAEYLVMQYNSRYEALRALTKEMGYGAAVITIQMWWEEQDGGYAQVLGPQKELTVACGCDRPLSCKWCAGSGWLTEHVKDLKDQTEGK